MHDHRACPHCGRDIGEGEYLMSQRTDEPFDFRYAAWGLVVLLSLVVALLASPRHPAPDSRPRETARQDLLLVAGRARMRL